MYKVINMDGKEVKMRATASVPRLYRIKFGRDIMKDMQKLQESASKAKEQEFTIEDLEIFENVAYIMARHGDPENTPSDINEWLDQFETFSVYTALPEILELWGLNTRSEVESKKKIGQLSAK